VLSAPTINQGITGRDVTIAGNFTQAEAEKIAAELSSGTSQAAPSASTAGTAVPDVEGLPQTEAITRLRNVGFFSVTVFSTCATGKAGTVIKQDPAAGTVTSPQTLVNLTMAKACSGQLH
jgi:beta-lactam-binding protein with PASTA domain